MTCSTFFRLSLGLYLCQWWGSLHRGTSWASCGFSLSNEGWSMWIPKSVLINSDWRRWLSLEREREASFKGFVNTLPHGRWGVSVAGWNSAHPCSLFSKYVNCEQCHSTMLCTILSRNTWGGKSWSVWMWRPSHTHFRPAALLWECSRSKEGASGITRWIKKVRKKATDSGVTSFFPVSWLSVGFSSLCNTELSA